MMIPISLEEAQKWSHLQRIHVALRLRGSKIDMDKIKEGISILEPEVKRLREEIYHKIYCKTHDLFYNKDIDSPKQLGEVLIQCGYKLPKSKKGGDSTNKKWLESQDDELCKLIVEYRSTQKILNDFFIKIRDMQQYTCPEAYCGGKYGRIFPELNILGANATGRTSSSNPNEQNIPKRNEKFGKLIRSIFVCENPVNDMYVMDYSNQEGRLQVHYAFMIAARGATSTRHMLNENKWLDLHKLTYSTMFNVDYDKVTKDQKNFVKPINLGLAYGMQSGSLARAIGKPTKTITTKRGYKMEVAGDEAQEILNLHKEMQPYVYILIEACKKKIIDKGYITTIGGRKLMKDKFRDYTGISKLIQGSAADFGYEVLRKSYEQGILPLLYVHDEFVVEGLDNAKKVKYNMENAYKISVPMAVEVKVGKNWGETVVTNDLEESEVKIP